MKDFVAQKWLLLLLSLIIYPLMSIKPMPSLPSLSDKVAAWPL